MAKMSNLEKETLIKLTQQQIALLNKQLSILKGVEHDAEEAVKKPSVKKKKKDADEEEEVKTKKPPTEYAKFTSEVSKLVKEALNGEKMKAGFHQKVAGYMHKMAKTSATLENVKDAIKYLDEHPEYTSSHAEKMSAKNSVGSNDEKKEKKQKKEKKEKKVEAESEDLDGEDDDAEIEMELWEHEGESYMRSQFNDITTTDDIKYVGFWDGSKIDTTVKMPLRIKKFIDSL